MFKKLLFLGLLAGLGAGVTSVIYAQVYNGAFGTDFSLVVNPISIMSSCIFGGVLASVGYMGLSKLIVRGTEMVFNIIFVLLSFASILVPLVAKLPYDVDFPELFPGFAIPMHFFPALFWFALRPIFFKKGMSEA